MGEARLRHDMVLMRAPKAEAAPALDADTALVLEAFAEPRTVLSAVAWLVGRGGEATSAFARIAAAKNAGLLHAPSPSGADYTRPSAHIEMLDDRERTDAFAEALRRSVHETDVVVDIGTGTGILSVLAARAGARRVLAIEASAMAETARAVFAKNGVDGRVTVVRGDSRRIVVPERGSLLVTEMLGNDPLDEEILEIVADARARLLRPGARTIPAALELVAVPLALGRTLYERHVFSPSHVAAWRDAYGVDFSPVLAHEPHPAVPFRLTAAEAAALRRPAAPLSLAHVTLDAGTPRTLEAQGELVLEEDVEHLGVMLAFRATLAPGVVLSTVPGEGSPDSHWRAMVRPATHVPRASRGDRLEIRMRYARGVTRVEIERAP